MPIISKRKLITNVAAYAPAASAFTPASLPGLVAWYDASTAANFVKQGGGSVTNGDTIGTWADMSGHGYTMTGGAAGASPVYSAAGFNGSKPAAYWNGGFRTLISANTIAGLATNNACSCFVVGRMLGAGVSYAHISAYQYNSDGNNDGPGSAIFLLRDSGNNAIETRGGGGLVASNAFSMDTPVVWGVTQNASACITYINNASPVSDTGRGTNVFASPGVIGMGSNISGGGPSALGFEGMVSEYVLTNAVLSTGDRNSLYTYFQSKWGL